MFPTRLPIRAEAQTRETRYRPLYPPPPDPNLVEMQVFPNPGRNPVGKPWMKKFMYCISGCGQHVGIRDLSEP